VHYRLNQNLDLDAYVQNRIQLAHYDLEGVTVKVANTKDFEQIVKIVDKFRTSTRIADRTERRDVCIVAYKQGVLAHLRWAAMTPIPLKEFGGRVVQLASNEAFTYDAYTVPAFRRKGIGSEAKMFLMTYLKQHGIRHAYSDSRLDNRNTQQVWRKRAWEGRQRIIGIVTVTTRLGRKYYTFAAETEETRPLIARLFHIPLQNVRIRSIYQFLPEQQPVS
jgi:GNAT superfamily N-acetyltransferase